MLTKSELIKILKELEIKISITPKEWREFERVNEVLEHGTRSLWTIETFKIAILIGTAELGSNAPEVFGTTKKFKKVKAAFKRRKKNWFREGISWADALEEKLKIKRVGGKKDKMENT